MRPQMHILHILLLFVARVVFTSAQPCQIGYTGPDPLLWCTCNAGYVGRNFIAPYSPTACDRFIALRVPQRSLVSVATANNAPVGTLPTYVAGGGPNGKGHVSFNRALSNFIDGGARTFNINSNGGFTFVAVVRFTSSIITLNRLFYADGGGTTSSFQMNIEVVSTDGFKFQIGSSSATIASIQTPSYALKLNVWTNIVCSYQSSSRTIFIYMDGVLIKSQYFGSLASNRNMIYTYLGRHPTGRYWNGDMAGAFVVDEFLTIEACNAIANAMRNGVDLTSTTCPNGPPCVSAASVPCNAGYTGPNGGPCTECVAGKYKTTTGSAVCTACGPGKYSSTLSSTSVSTCLTCPANSGATCSFCSSSTSCSCNSGYTGPSGGVCNACAAGTYKPITGPDACSTCPADRTSSVGSTSSAACISTPCNAGYTGKSFLSPYSITACNRFVALILSKCSVSYVSTRSNAGSGNLPTYNAIGQYYLENVHLNIYE